MNGSAPMESALILTVPAADPVVHEHRLALDPAAAAGVPAHITVLYPFKPVDRLTAQDLETLTTLAARMPAFEVTFSTTQWFRDNVVYLAPDDPQPLVRLIEAVGEAFPDHPRYGGAFDDVVPHLTIGSWADPARLRDAEQLVRPQLPISQQVSRLELWSGPPPAGGEGFWSRHRTFALAI